MRLTLYAKNVSFVDCRSPIRNIPSWSIPLHIMIYTYMQFDWITSKNREVESVKRKQFFQHHYFLYVESEGNHQWTDRDIEHRVGDIGIYYWSKDIRRSRNGSCMESYSYISNEYITIENANLRNESYFLRLISKSRPFRSSRTTISSCQVSLFWNLQHLHLGSFI